MSTAKSVGTDEGGHLTVIESHTAKDGSDVLLFFGSVWETSIGGTGGDIAIGTARSPWDLRTLAFLDGARAGKSPEIGVGDPREFFYKQ